MIANVLPRFYGTLYIIFVAAYSGHEILTDYTARCTQDVEVTKAAERIPVFYRQDV